MGTTRVCKYRIEFDGRGCGGPVGLNRKVNLEEYVMAMVDSFKIGGVNQHISKSLGYIPVPTGATLIRQKDGVVISRWKAPMFMAI